MTDHIYAHEHPESDRKRDGGFTLWFTGLSGSGKTTIAHFVGPELERRGHVVEYLDGDTVRTNLSKGLGFSKEDRDTNIERIGWVAARLTRHGAAVIAAAISPYEETRQKARDLVEEWGTFVEVHIATSVEECARRDVKGLYEKAFAGEIKGFTGVDGEADRQRPRQAALEVQLLDDAPVVRLAHEALERRERARGEHVQVGQLARAEANHVEARHVLRLARAVDQRAAVGRDEVLRRDRAHAVTWALF